MYARHPLESHDDTPVEDHVVMLSGITWRDYERLLEIRGERSRPKMTFLEGRLEIMSPSRDHEKLKSLIGQLVEVYCLERGIRFTAYGSWTIRDESAERGAEPDECYILGSEDAERPHLAIEVVWTSGGLDKLDVYRKLGVREVWYWRKGKLSPYALRGETYEPIAQSEVVPDIDLEHLASYLDRPTAYDAIVDYRVALRAKSGG